MKKITLDGPDYGVFQFGSATTAIAYVEAPSPQAMNQGFNWDEEIACPAPRLRLYRDVFKRVMDVTFVLLTLPFSLPIMLICAIALWIEGGSPIYVQDRIGAKGARFSIFKLRTMVRDADAVLESYLAADPAMRREWDDLQKIKNDPRITRVGQFLRTTSLDELPQLINVLIGDMSLVGPRPMLPEQQEMYGNSRHYCALKPGITGLWQISARNNNKFTYRNEVDAAYERALTLSLDVKVLFKTIGVVLRRTGH